MTEQLDWYFHQEDLPVRNTEFFGTVATRAFKGYTIGNEKCDVVFAFWCVVIRELPLTIYQDH